MKYFSCSTFIKPQALFSLLLLFLSIFFYLFNLDNWFLWQDEANAALLAKNTLKFGFPFVYDGKNCLWPYPTDVSLKFHYWIVWGWLPIYINAFIFKILGISTFTARLGSALVAIFFIQISYWSLRRVFHEKGVAETVVLILLFCVPLSLFFRQCGYYAFAATIPFGMYLLLFHALPIQIKPQALQIKPQALQTMSQVLFRYLQNHRRWTFILLSLALVNTHVLTWGITLVSLGLLVLIRTEDKKNLFKTLFFSGLLALPFLAFYEVWLLFERMQTKPNFPPYSIRFLDYLDSFHIAIFPVWYATLLLILGWIIRKYFTKSEKKTLLDIFIITGLSLLIIPLITRYSFFRYMLFLIPFIALFVGIIHVRILKSKRILGIFALLILILQFGLGFRMSSEGRSLFLMQHFLYELTHDGEDLNEALCNYLNTHTKPNETVFCAYGEFPLQFYTSLKVRGGLGYIGIIPEKIFPEHGIEPMNIPDWIVMRESWKYIYGDAFFEELFKNARYEKIILPVEETIWGNRADPFHHFYATPLIQRPLVIYHIAKPPTSTGKKSLAGEE